MPPRPRYAPLQIFVTLPADAALLQTACSPSPLPAAAATAVPITGNNAPADTLLAGAAIPETHTLAVTVADQAITSGQVSVASVTSPGPGWIAIHINSGGKPGEIIGWAQVKPGVNPNVVVTIDPSKATPVLYAMLYVDAGTVGTYEFSGPDVPVTFQGQMVSPATVSAADSTKLGKILVNGKGITLYNFQKDSPGKSNCTGGCLENWPLLLLIAGSLTPGVGATGKLGQIASSDNGTQVTYNEAPLYYFVGDKAPGDVNGQGIGGAWFAATP